MKSLNPYHTLQLRPNNETTTRLASINVSTMLCLQRRITRSVRSKYMATYQWGGQWTNGRYMPNNGPAGWIEPDRDEDYKPLPEFHTTSHRQPHFKANMPPNQLTKLPQADTMDKLRFHAHFEDATGLDGIRTRMKGDLVTKGSIFIPRTRLGEPSLVSLRETAIHIPSGDGINTQRASVPVPCPGVLHNQEVTVDDLTLCFEGMCHQVL